MVVASCDVFWRRLCEVAACMGGKRGKQLREFAVQDIPRLDAVVVFWAEAIHLEMCCTALVLYLEEVY